MSAARKLNNLNAVTLEEYFAAEEVSDIRHEYLAGVVSAMAGETNRHSRLATKIIVALSNALEGKRCEAYGSDTSIKLDVDGKPYVYYPDISVVCESNPDDARYQEQPVVIVEVLSPSTRKNDIREKLHAYLTLPSLRVYMVVEQEFPHVTCHRRTESGFAIELYDQLSEVIPLPEIEAELPLARIYEGVEFDEVEAAEG